MIHTGNYFNMHNGLIEENVCYLATKEFYGMCHKSAESLISRKNADVFLNLVIITVEDTVFFNDLNSETVSVKIHKVDLDEYYTKLKDDDFNEALAGISNHDFKYCFLKIEATRLPYDRVLYLDCDTIVFQDISELFTMELNEEITAVKDYYDRKGDMTTTFFNAGVLLFNNAKIRETSLFADFIAEAKTVSTNDQEIFNRRFGGTDKIKYLPPVYHFSPVTFFSTDTDITNYLAEKPFNGNIQHPFDMTLVKHHIFMDNVKIMHIYGQIKQNYNEIYNELTRPTFHYLTKNPYIFGSIINLLHSQFGHVNNLEKNSVVFFGKESIIEFFDKVRQSNFNKTIYYELEHLHCKDEEYQEKWVKQEIENCKKFDEVWTYTLENAEVLKSNGVKNVLFHPFLYNDGLRNETLANSYKNPNKPIDVLFFGHLSNYRRELFKQVEELGVKFVYAHAVTGNELAWLEGNSKIILDAGNIESSHNQNVVRLNPLAINNLCVLSQHSDNDNYMGDSIEYFTDETDIKQKIVNLLRNNRWQEVASKAAEKYKLLSKSGDKWHTSDVLK